MRTHSETFSDYKRLEELLSQIQVIYAETVTSNKITLEKRVINYHQGTKCIEQATEILNQLYRDISEMDFTYMEKNTNQGKLHNMLELLDNSNLKFQELLAVYTELHALKNKINTTSTIINDVQKDVIIEEELEDIM